MNEYNNKLEVIRNRCRTSAKVVGILRTLTGVGLIGSLVGAIICFFQRTNVNEQVAAEVAAGNLKTETLRLGGSMLNVVIDYSKAFEEGNYAGPIIVSCVVAAVICAAMVVILTLFKRIFTELSLEETPFSESVMGRLKTSFIIMTVVLAVFIGVGAGIIGGLFMWCVYSILDYGKVLQTEVDETL